MDPKIKEYLEKNVLEELGLKNLSPDETEKLFVSLGEIIQGRINLRIIDELAEADKNAFYALLDQKQNDAEVTAFLQEKIPNLNDLVAQVIAESKQEIVEKTKLLGK